MGAVGGLVAIIALVLIFMAMFTVPSGFVGVKYSFGKISPDELQPGMHIITPFVDDVRLFDVKSQTVNYNTRDNLPDSDGVINLPNIAILMDKVKTVQEAKQEEQRLVMVLKQAEQTQKINTTNAETKMIEATTAARAEAERLRLVSEGNAKAILIEAEAQAKANEVVAKSVTPALIEYNAVKNWNGAPPQTLVSHGNESIPNMILGIK